MFGRDARRKLLLSEKKHVEKLHLNKPQDFLEQCPLDRQIQSRDV